MILFCCVISLACAAMLVPLIIDFIRYRDGPGAFIVGIFLTLFIAIAVLAGIAYSEEQEVKECIKTEVVYLEHPTRGQEKYTICTERVK